MITCRHGRGGGGRGEGGGGGEKVNDAELYSRVMSESNTHTHSNLAGLLHSTSL